METLKRIGAVSYGMASYLTFFLTFLYLVGFLANVAVGKSIDSGPVEPFLPSLAVNVFLLVLFGVQHTVMARPGFKRAIASLIPHSIERSTYVLVSSLLLMLLFWQWRPMPQQIWAFENTAAFWTMTGLFLAGYALLLYATFLIDHFDLFGLRQVVLRATGKGYSEKHFATPGLYKLIRHPIYVGWMVGFWATPVMSVGHLLLASVWTAYMVIAVRYEERDLRAALGEPYEKWRAETGAFVPRIVRSPETRPASVVREVR
ncbi:MAG TPA: isoprenylcysteine carboxylmethyltransferase family protein [Myxococcota bacterium]|nr:isoprenylcysteine carboxylmethyltransferase family protein [Myxococcota bacterium]